MRFARNNLRFLLFLAAFVCATGRLDAQTAAGKGVWIATWGAAQQVPEPQNALPPDDLRDATVRQIFHLSAGGGMIRVHVSNAFGTEALHFTSVHIARPLARGTSEIDAGSDRALRFAGAAGVTVPAGAEFVSDPIDYPVAALSDLAVTFHLKEAPARETGHPGSRATSYYVRGDSVGAAVFAAPRRVEHWISEIDVRSDPEAASVVALGDSITDGHGTTTDGNDRWTDVLASRLQQSPATRNIGVVNEEIGGNHLLTDGLGPSALACFDRDVLAPSGVRWLIVLEGVNDLGGLTRAGEVPAAEHAALVGRVIAAYQQILVRVLVRAHAHGIRVIGATITPYMGSDYYHPDALNEADRHAVNRWIRAAGHFDATVDFDAVVRDPRHPDRLLPAYDSGDHLHPSPAGYRAMGEAIALALFVR